MAENAMRYLLGVAIATIGEILALNVNGVWIFFTPTIVERMAWCVDGLPCIRIRAGRVAMSISEALIMAVPMVGRLEH